MADDLKKDSNPSPWDGEVPTAKPFVDGAPVWMGRPIAHPKHAEELERDAAFNEFGTKMSRDEAESAAYDNYSKRQRVEAAAHHLAGMKAARAGGDMEAARKHGAMYDLHVKALGHEPVGPTHPDVASYMAQNPGVGYKFKPHRGDLFAVHAKAPESPQEVTKAEPGIDLDQALKTLHEAASVVLDMELLKAEDKHCEKTKLCREHRPCTCPCDSCSKMPMTDDRDGKTYTKKLPPPVSKQELGKGDVVGSIGNPEGAKPQPKGGGKGKFHDIGIGEARRWAKKNGMPLHPNAPKYGSYFEKASDLNEWAKAELAKKTEMSGRALTRPCVCTSYHFPHRYGSGKCGKK
jgi:hypothetical protein